jgi:hypothetical protein
MFPFNWEQLYDLEMFCVKAATAPAKMLIQLPAKSSVNSLYAWALKSV